MRAAAPSCGCTPRELVPPPTPKGVVALFSCSAKEKAYESDKLKHGVFFHYVIEALRGKRGHLAYRVFESQVAFFPHINTQDTGKGAKAARMRMAARLWKDSSTVSQRSIAPSSLD